MVKTVQGAANYEKGTLEAVINARAKATSVQVNADNLDENSIAQFQKAQDELSSALSRLMVVVERYPELKASDLYLQAQQGQKEYEEKVRLSRMVYNDTATKMNRYVRQWPSSFIAGMLNFGTRNYLKMDNEGKRDITNMPNFGNPRGLGENAPSQS